MGFDLMKNTTNWIIGICVAVGCSITAYAQPAIINDQALRQNLETKLGKLVDTNKTVSGEELNQQLSRKLCKLDLPAPSSESTSDVYSQSLESVAILSSVFKCGSCDKWHLRSAATAWALTKDGVMVTNYHVFMGKTNLGTGVATRDGRVFPVVEILAADEASDIAIFRVEGANFKPLPLGQDAKVGSKVHIVSHPDGRFYSYSSGGVSRYNMGEGKHSVPWMSISAEFARGSSGGPVLDDAGNLVGMVAHTQWVYYKNDRQTQKREDLQMVVRNCVPVLSIRKLIEQ